MNQVDLPILADKICQQHFKGFIPNTEICAGYENAHKDWCTVSITQINHFSFLTVHVFIFIQFENCVG